MEMVSFLVEHDANVNQADSEGWTPLHVAASCGYPDIAECVVYMSLQCDSFVILCNIRDTRMHCWNQSVSALNSTNIVLVFGSARSQHEWACLGHESMEYFYFLQSFVCCL